MPLHRILQPVLTPEQKKLIRIHSKLKLRIELVPLKCHLKNVRSRIRKSQWNKIRQQVYMKANYHCEICGKQGTMPPVECHEVWVYNEKTSIQKLKGFRAICPLCHEVIHYGRAMCIGNEDRAFDRFMKINKLNKVAATDVISAVWRQ